ncbi:MAG: hypothetical protein MK020_03460 [Dehalococcoidia bacterium]|nr:hypothetical protein [Dehalococcoidia bacterium]
MCLLTVGCSGGAENIAQPNAPTIEATIEAISVTPTPSPTTSRPISTANTAAIPTMAAPAATPAPVVVATPSPTPAQTVVPTQTPTVAPAPTSAPTPAQTVVPTPTPPPVVASSGANSGSDIPFMVYGTGANSGDTIFVLVANDVIEIVTASSEGNWGPVLANGKKGDLITFLLNGAVVDQSAEWEPGGTPQNVQTGFVLTLKQ